MCRVCARRRLLHSMVLAYLDWHILHKQHQPPSVLWLTNVANIEEIPEMLGRTSRTRYVSKLSHFLWWSHIIHGIHRYLSPLLSVAEMHCMRGSLSVMHLYERKFECDSNTQVVKYAKIFNTEFNLAWVQHFQKHMLKSLKISSFYRLMRQVKSKKSWPSHSSRLTRNVLF